MSHGACERCGEPLDGDELPGLRGRRRDLRRPVELTYKHRGIVVIWRCPFCGHGWPRFESGELHDAAVLHLRSEEQLSYERAPSGHQAAVKAKPLPLPDVDPDRKVQKVKGVPLAGEQPVPRRGVQRNGARTGHPVHKRRPQW